MKGWIGILIMIALRLSEIVVTYQVEVSSTAPQEFCSTRQAQCLQPWLWSSPHPINTSIHEFSLLGGGQVLGHGNGFFK